LLLAQSAAALRAGDLGRAETGLKQILQQAADHPVALFMMGMISAERAQWPSAERQFRQALASAPDRPDICLNLAYVLRAQHRPSEAIAYCQAVLTAAPGRTDALLELGKAQQQMGELAHAESSFRQIFGRTVDSWGEISLAELFNQAGKAEAADALLRPIAEKRDRSAEAQIALELQLGRALKAQRRHDEALSRLNRATVLGGNRDIMLECANVLQHLGRLDEAASVLQTWLDRAPDDMTAHLLLNEIHYRQHQDDKFLTSYESAAAKRPDLPHLLATKGHHLLKVGRGAQAVEVYERVLRAAPEDADALSGLARALETVGEIEQARRRYHTCLARYSGNGEILESYAGFLLRQGEAKEAQQLSEKAIAARPLSQGAYALLSLCYRAQNDAREELLNNYDQFIQIMDLDPPDGFGDMQTFNRELDAYLASVHPANEGDYFTQTARGGSRINDEMFFNGHRLVDLLQPRIAGAIRHYALALKAPADHPFVSRRRRGFSYAGSWSSRLADCGYHVNHIHQKGWISACYYVGLPDVVTEGKDRQGWIKFGEPPVEFGPNFALRRAIQPRPGRLVLFPSYMWHGTEPFRAPQARTTIAFDVAPA